MLHFPRPDGVPVPSALAAMQHAAGKPICLIIDEAQHALTSETGLNTMAALKSARDQMNKPGAPTLLLVMSGSDPGNGFREPGTMAPSGEAGANGQRRRSSVLDEVGPVCDRFLWAWSSR